MTDLHKGIHNCAATIRESGAGISSALSQPVSLALPSAPSHPPFFRPRRRGERLPALQSLGTQSAPRCYHFSTRVGGDGGARHIGARLASRPYVHIHTSAALRITSYRRGGLSRARSADTLDWTSRYRIINSERAKATKPPSPSPPTPRTHLARRRSRDRAISCEMTRGASISPSLS